MAMHWLPSMSTVPGTAPASPSAVELGQAGIISDHYGTVAELLARATPVAVADGEPAAAGAMTPPLAAKAAGRSRASSAGVRPMSPSGSSGVMVTEEKDDGSEGRSSRSFEMQRLSVPNGSDGK